MTRRFKIVIASPARGETGNSYRLTRFGRVMNILAGIAVITVALAVLMAALILGYIIAAVLAILVIVVIAILALKSLFRRRPMRPDQHTRG